MRPIRIAAAVAVLVVAALGLSVARTLGGSIEGTLTVGNGSGYVNSREVTVHAPATGSATIEFVELVVGVESVTGLLPYVETFQATLPDMSVGLVRARWTDSDGDTAWSASQWVTIDDTPPQWAIQSLEDEDPGDDLIDIELQADGPTPIVAVRFSADGTTWGADVTPTGGPFQVSVKYPLYDPVYGGKPVLGNRKVWMKIQDAAGSWSNVRSRSFTATVDTSLTVSPAQPVTGRRATFTPELPEDVSFPAGTRCMWEFMWGNERSLYWGDRDDTFGFIHTYGPKGAGFCDPRTFTMPWVAYPRMLVHFQADGPDGETIAEAWIGESPEAEAVVPVIESTSRHIAYSNIPMAYVLPEDYILELGRPTTYRLYTIGNVPTAGGTWSADMSADADDRFKEGGTSFTFTPTATGYVTVCWGSDTSKSTRYSACYDPPVRRRDGDRPTTTRPVQQVQSTTAGGSTAPVRISWTGDDVGWGIAKYQLERSVDGGAWKRVLSRKERGYSAALTPGKAYRFRVRAVDKYGNVGAWDVGPTFRPRVTEDGSSAITYTGDWTAATDATARGGSLHESSSASADAAYTFTGRDVAWLAERGPGHGKAQVYVDGKLAATVDLAAASESPARVVYRRHWGTSGEHRIRIVVEGTEDRPVVGVDGFLVLR